MTREELRRRGKELAKRLNLPADAASEVLSTADAARHTASTPAAAICTRVSRAMGSSCCYCPEYVASSRRRKITAAMTNRIPVTAPRITAV